MHIRAMQQLLVGLASALLLGLAPAAHAGIFRAYLSTSGSDTNPCTLQQPCRLLPAALAAVNAGGEIWMLDSANYNTGPVNIAKSVTILAIPGALGSVVGNGQDAIVVSTADVNVTLRNLNIVFLGGAGSGIAAWGSGARITVEKCEIYGFPEKGIFIAGGANLIMIETTVRDNQDGIRLENGANGMISQSHVLNNAFTGIFADSSVLTVNETVSSGNTYGFASTSGANLFANRTKASDNECGYVVEEATLAINGSVASGNSTGLCDYGGTLQTTGTTLVAGNMTERVGALYTISPK